jgi:diguanylate cyclase (GGDEF)-like protein
VVFMNQWFKKIFGTLFSGLFNNSRSFYDDLQQINKIFSQKQEHLKTDKEQHGAIQDLLRKICAQSRTEILFYSKHKNGVSRWHDHADKKIESPYFFKYLDKNSDLIFEHEIQVHTAPMPLSKKFLAFRLGQKFFYVLDIPWKKFADRYYDFLYTHISFLLKTYKGIRDKQRLTSRISNMQNELIEKEKSLIVAERAVKRKVYDLHNLVEASNEIYSILNFKQLINSALLTIIGQLGIQSAFALMFDSSRHTFSKNFQKGFREEEITQLKFKGESSLAKYLQERETPIYVDEMDQEVGHRRYRDKLKKLNIQIVAPIVYSERLQGIIGISTKLYEKEFTQTDFELFHVLVNIISISIENALHYEEAKNLSLTDGMTNLHNYRYFSIRLKEELNRAKRNKTKVSLLILDIDHFKNYNDTLGHQAGDEALRTVGRVLKSTVRDEDVVSRYGGEEFCIILPGISKVDIEPLGERVRRIIELHQFYKERVQPNGKITVSLGGSTYPDDAKDSDDLIQKADQALYKAKNHGRNRLVIYSKSKILTKEPIPLAT